MLSLVNYGASDSEDDITDEEEDDTPKVQLGEAQPDDDIDDLILQTKSSTIKLPKPSTSSKINILEEEDEFLHKKEEPSVAPPKKGKVKIMIPRLSDFKDDDDDKGETKIQPANRKTGLLSMLPRPSRSFAPAPKPSTSSSVEQLLPKVSKPATESPGQSSDAPKKVGLIPYSLMSHKPKASEEKKAAKKKDEDSDDDDEEPTGSFFTFASQDDESALPHVSEDEVQALVAKQTERMEQRKRQAEESETPFDPYENEAQDYQQPEQSIDEEAMRHLLGGNKAKRSRTDNIQIIDLSAAEVMPNRDEWVRKTLAGETSYIPTGQIVEKVNHPQFNCVIRIITFDVSGTECIGEEKASNQLLIDASREQ